MQGFTVMMADFTINEDKPAEICINLHTQLKLYQLIGGG